MASMLTNVPGSRDLVIQKVGTGEVLSCSRGGETCFRIPFWTIPKMSVCDPSSRKQSNQVLVTNRPYYLKYVDLSISDPEFPAVLCYLAPY